MFTYFIPFYIYTNDNYIFYYSSKNYNNRKPIRINCTRDRNIISCPNYGNFRYNNNRNWSNKNSNIQTEVNNLYVQVLGRNADANGLRSYVQVVNQGRSLAEVRRNLANSQEFNQSINKVYQEFLGRNVDNNGLQSYRNAVINGRSFEEVRNEIANSPEARNRNGNYNNGNYNNGGYNPTNNNSNQEINNLYVQVLGRNANTNELRSYSQAINNQGWSLAQARRNLVNTQEFNQTINNVYRDFLGRNADNNGLQSYRNQVINGRSFEEVRNEIANSPEARNRNNNYNNNDNYNQSDYNFEEDIKNMLCQSTGLCF